MKWITRERPKIDRLACPWLIKKFIDPRAEFLYVPSDEVISTAKEVDAIPYDVPAVELTHDGPLCSFDAFIKKYQLKDPALDRLALIVRAADTDTLEKDQASYGLLAITLGLGKNITNDHELLIYAMTMYDALYTWCKELVDEKHGWYPEQIKLLF
jgi:hypothetical protein